MNTSQKINLIKHGFTLIELLIVIAIIAIIAAVAFVALDPLTRFKDARDAKRWSDTSAILSAIKIHQIDNKGSYLQAIGDMQADNIYMIGIDTTGCDDYNIDCDAIVASDTACVNIAGLETNGYLGSVPVSPDGDGVWTDGHTGYTLKKGATTGIITVQACESENSNEIKISR